MRSEVVARLARFKVIILGEVSPMMMIPVGARQDLDKVGWLAYYMIVENFLQSTSEL